jgi:rfaE bifunctional protein nucleotidyltransferase chain/domain
MAKEKLNDSEILVKDILDSNAKLDKRVISDLRQLKKTIKKLKDAGFRIVLTQGVWDLIHEGHARYLERAKKLGDILVVGVDSDELTKKRKGPRRPIVPEDERIRMISHLRHVDIITLRKSNQDIGKLIRTIEPDVLVVSQTTKDFTNGMKNSYTDCCGKIVNLKHQATTSTSARIRNLTIEGAEELANKINSLIGDFLDQSK